jgi:hypothetical protein
MRLASRRTQVPIQRFLGKIAPWFLTAYFNRLASPIYPRKQRPIILSG